MKAPVLFTETYIKRIFNTISQNDVRNFINQIYEAGYEQASEDALARIENNEKKLIVRGQPWEILTCPRCDSAKVSMIQNEINGVTEKSYDCQNCGCTWDVL